MAGLIGSALGAGIGGAGAAMKELTGKYIDDDRKIDVQRQLMDMEVEKQNRLEEMRSERKFADDLRRSDPTGQLATNERAGKKLDKEQELGIERNETLTRGGDKQYLGARRAIKQSEHIESASSVADADFKREQTAMLRERNGLVKQYRNAKTAEQRNTALEDLRAFDALNPQVSGGRGASPETDTVKVTEEKFNDDGSTTKTERTEKRKAPAGGVGASASQNTEAAKPWQKSWNK